MRKGKRQLNDFEKDLRTFLKNPENKRLYDKYGLQLNIAYQILQLRKQKRMSRASLAKKIDTKPNVIARMETDKQRFSLGMLEKIAGAFNKELEVQFR